MFFGQPFDIKSDIKWLIVEGLAYYYYLLSINYIKIFEQCLRLLRRAEIIVARVWMRENISIAIRI